MELAWNISFFDALAMLASFFLFVDTSKIHNSQKTGVAKSTFPIIKNEDFFYNKAPIFANRPLLDLTTNLLSAKMLPCD